MVPPEIKTIKEYMEAKLTVAGFDFIEEGDNIIAWPQDDEESSIVLEFHAPGAYAVAEGAGFFEYPGRQKSFQNQVVNWVYEYYSGGVLR